MRNPFDNITTLAIRATEQAYLRAVGFSPEVEGCIDDYFELCDSTLQIRKNLTAEETIEFRHESFVAAPRVMLAELCQRLCLETTKKYLDACVGIVNAKPNHTRHRRAWSNKMKKRCVHE